MAVVQKIRQRLTDGSHVFDVSLLSGSDQIIFNCVNEAAADLFITAVSLAIIAHTDEDVEDGPLLETVA